MGASGSISIPTHGQSGKRSTVVLSGVLLPRGAGKTARSTKILYPSSLAVAGRASSLRARRGEASRLQLQLPNGHDSTPGGWMELSRGLRSAARDDTPGMLTVLVTTPEGSRRGLESAGLPASFQYATRMDVVHRGCRFALPPAKLRKPSGLDYFSVRPGAVGTPRPFHLRVFLPIGLRRIRPRLPESDTIAPDIPHRIPLPDIKWRSFRGRIPQLAKAPPDVPRRVPFLHFAFAPTPRCLAEVPLGFRRVLHRVPQDSTRPPAVRFNNN